jgi:hypothetical protein
VTRRAGTGFVAVELVAAVALLLLPTIVLVASLPVWSARRHAATVVAREAARTAAAHWPDPPGVAVDAVVASEAADYGVPADELAVAVHLDDTRSGQANARVTILMPTVSLPLIGTVASWHFTTTYAVRIDDYRSR